MTAIKLRIQDLIQGTYDGTCIHTCVGEVSEVRILGTLIDIFVTDDDSYISLTLDDGTETVRIKAWRQDVKRLKAFSRGDLVDVVGKAREYNEEIYVVPDVISKVSPNKWVLRELELMKLYIQSGAVKSIKKDELAGAPETAVGSPEPEVTEPPEPELQHSGEQGKRESPKEVEEFEIVGEEEEEIEEFEILGEDEVVETVLSLLSESMTKEEIINTSGLDEIDVELALRELMDEGKVEKEDNTYKKVK